MRRLPAARPLSRPPRRPPGATAAAGLVAVLTAATACSSGPAAGLDAFGLPLHRPVTEQELRAHPEALLLYPGSRLVRRVGSDERRQPGAEEPDPAYAGATAVARVPAERLYGWYDRRLVALGYRRAPFYRTSDELSGRAWTVPRGTEQIQVAVFAAGHGGPAAGGVPVGGVAYEQLLVDYRVTGPPPAPRP